SDSQADVPNTPVAAKKSSEAEAAARPAGGTKRKRTSKNGKIREEAEDEAEADISPDEMSAKKPKLDDDPGHVTDGVEDTSHDSFDHGTDGVEDTSPDDFDPVQCY
ncbi:hypothetical protein K490DRAFT_60750, partial [Saccharata proteae CBS 121410]